MSETDPTVKDYLTVQPLLSHGCYNQNIMKHVRPEHDYRTTGNFPVVETPLVDMLIRQANIFNGRESCLPPGYGEKLPQKTMPSSVIPWMSR